MKLARHAVNIEGAEYKPSELAALGAFLIEHALLRPDDRTANPLRTIVQLGVGRSGGALWFWRKLAPEAVIVGVDLDVRCDDCARRRPHSDCPRQRCRQQATMFIEAHPSDRATVSAVAREVGLTLDLAYGGGVFGEGDGIDLLFMDQSWPNIEAAWQDYVPLLSSQGIVAMHGIAGAIAPAQLSGDVEPTAVQMFWHNMTLMIPQAFGIVKDAGGAWGGIGVIPKAQPQAPLPFPV
jgi:predicted O-methyltransferase YrrM